MADATNYTSARLFEIVQENRANSPYLIYAEPRNDNEVYAAIIEGTMYLDTGDRILAFNNCNTQVMDEYTEGVDHCLFNDGNESMLFNYYIVGLVTDCIELAIDLEHPNNCCIMTYEREATSPLAYIYLQANEIGTILPQIRQKIELQPELPKPRDGITCIGCDARIHNLLC